MKKLLFSAVLVTAMLLTAGGQEASAQSRAEELKTYLQQLEVDKVQYKNDPARYQEYENKITAIKSELGESTTSQTPNAQETEQERMARTLSSDDYAKWKLQQSVNNTPAQQAEQSKVSSSNKGARVMASPTAKMHKQQLGGVQITTHQNAQTTALRERSANGAKKEMSAAQKAIYQKYGLMPNISKDEMITWRKNNPTKWQAMRQELQNTIKTQQK